MLRSTIILSVVAAIGAAAPAAAQSRWSAELSGDAAVATQRFAGTELETGYGFGANVRYRFQPHLALYGGWEWHRFHANTLPGAMDFDVEETGYTFGLRFEHPLAGTTSGWLRAGGLGNHVELEDLDGDRLADSGHGLGFEIGGGLAIPVTERATLTPGVRYRWLRRDIDVGMERRSGTLAYVTFGAGFAVAF